MNRFSLTIQGKMIATLYCFERPDPYAIITSTFYILYALLGLLVNNSFLNDINSYLLLTGIGAILEFADILDEFHFIPLVFCSGALCYKLLAEIVKLWSGEIIDESEMVMGISGEKFYRLPASLISLLVRAYVLVITVYYYLFLVIPFLLFVQIIGTIAVFKFFPQGVEHYTKTRTMLLKSWVGMIVGCTGLGTTMICPGNNWTWIRLFVGYPIANLCLPYSLFTLAQLVILLRGKNLFRQTAIRGNNFIFIAYYAGRFRRQS